jgi:hypothetical protein
MRMDELLSMAWVMIGAAWSESYAQFSAKDDKKNGNPEKTEEDPSQPSH